MSVFALPTVWAASTSEEETYVFHAGSVGAREPRVAFDAASGLGFDFTGYA